MKKLLLLSWAILVIVSGIYAQTDVAYVENNIKSPGKDETSSKKEKGEAKNELAALHSNGVSFFSQEQFNLDFGNITDVNWERTKNFDEATFTKDGQVTTAFYDQASQLVGTTTEKTFADLPQKARNIINKKYSDYTVGAVLFYDDSEENDTDMSLYNLEFNDGDSYFVELNKDNCEIVVRVTMDGAVLNFTQLK